MHKQIATALVMILFASPPALALHECGAQHPESGAQESQAIHGCDRLRETDFFNGDPRVDAPELARRGSYPVGVRTLEVVNPDQLDVLNYSAENRNPRYDRPLTLEIWYPAALEDGQKQITTYNDVLGHGAGNPTRPLLPFEFGGRAARDAGRQTDDGPFPLVVVSHGYSGSRVIMTWLTENLASKGYVVVAIDHTGSTHADATVIHSTLVHRAQDINFTIEKMSSMSNRPDGFLTGMVNAGQTAVIGYSMGTYGALNAAGVGVSEAAVNFPGGVPGGHLAAQQEGVPAYIDSLDPRIRVIVTFAPYGPPGFWTEKAAAELKVPSLFIVGRQDQTTGFAAAQWLFDNTVNSERYLLVYQGAIHEVAPNPAPPLASQHFREWVHYQEPAWDNRRLNNINQHFITAFLGTYLLGEDDRYADYLKLTPESNTAPRTDSTDPAYWKGFLPWTAIGMELHHREARQALAD